IVLILTILFFPKIPGKEDSYLSQISAAKTGVFLISVLGVIFLNAGMYTGYSYISEFLNVLTHIVGTNLSIVLLLYGVASIIGNWLGAKLLDRDSRKIILASPIVVSIILFGIFTVSSQTIPTVIF